MCACTEPVRTGIGAVCVGYCRPKWPITMLNHPHIQAEECFVFYFWHPMLVRPGMKRLFFPWKTKEEKARFARAPHDNHKNILQDIEHYLGCENSTVVEFPTDWPCFYFEILYQVQNIEYYLGFLEHNTLSDIPWQRRVLLQSGTRGTFQEQGIRVCPRLAEKCRNEAP